MPVFWVKPKSRELVYVASDLCIQHYGEEQRLIAIMFLSLVTHLLQKYIFSRYSVLALQKSSSKFFDPVPAGILISLKSNLFSI